MVHNHAHIAHPHVVRAAEPDVATVVSVVYVTATPTFSGPIGGYTTLAQTRAAQSPAAGGPNFYDAGASTVAPLQAVTSAVSSAQAATSTAAADEDGAEQSQPESQTSASIPQSTYHLHNTPPAAATATTFSSVVYTPPPAFSSVTPLVSSIASASLAGLTAVSTPSLVQNNAAPTASTTLSQDSTSSGMSSGAKAGLAFAIIMLVALATGAAFFFYRKKAAKKNGTESLDDEKSGYNHQPQASIASHVSVRRKNDQAPRLSLRPVTEMFPDMVEKQSTTVANGMLAAGAPRSRGPSPTPGSAAINPFDDPANAINEKNGPGPVDYSPAPDATPMPLAVVNDRSDTPVEAKRQSPPTGASPSGPTSGAPLNVHRVQMDFNPSMEDELELKAGQLVRMLHEYDDGWALCKRLDRSQQGVVPRTCLSRLPVKPRPAGPPPPHMRGPPPAGRPRQMSGAGVIGRPMGPPGAGRPRAPSNAPAPLNPANRSRANSASTASRRMTPPASSPDSSASSSPTNVQRKPVPGQAL